MSELHGNVRRALVRAPDKLRQVTVAATNPEHKTERAFITASNDTI